MTPDRRTLVVAQLERSAKKVICSFSYLKLHSVLKSRDITLPAKVCIVKAMVFPVLMSRYESWTIKKAEC